MTWIVPLTDVTIGEEEAAAACEVLRSGWLSQGARVEAFENAFASALDSPHAVAVSSGTGALHLAYIAAGLGRDDEFIVPALTFVATMNAGLCLGARPVLADCASFDDLTVSASDIESKITPNTHLIVTMPYGGFCPDMPAIMEIASRHGIPVVEDASHAPLAALDGRCMGAWGLMGMFSFFSNKNLATGEGGMIVTADDAIDARLRRLRSHGMTTLTWDRHRGHAAEYDVVEAGFNYRTDEIHAAIGLEQMKKLEAGNRKRIESSALLRQELRALGIAGLDIPFENPRGNPVCHLFPVLLPEGTDRAEFRRRLADDGIQTSIHYPLLSDFTVGRELFPPSEDRRLPIAEAVARRLVTLPMGPHLTPEKVSLIVESTGKALGV